MTGLPAPSEPTPAGLRLQVTARLSCPLAFTRAVSVADWPCARLLEEVDSVTQGYPLAQSLAEAWPHAAPAAPRPSSAPQNHL